MVRSAVLHRAARVFKRYHGRAVSATPECFAWHGGKLSPAASAAESPIGSTRNLSSRPDPFARRPTAKCDPYGQGGKPLMYTEAQNLLATVEPEWKLWKHETEEDDEHDKAAELDNNIIPFAIVRDFWHKDYMQGAQFVTHVSAVAQMNDHYPHQVILDRYLSRREKAWKVRTRIICRTVVLQGLSHHDFFLATLLDVETKRPEVAGLLAGTQKERKL